MNYRRRRILLEASVLALLLLGLYSFYLANRPPKDLAEYMEIHGECPVVFSEESGFYDGGLSLEISAPGRLPKGAAIYYTLDGSEPTAESPLYEAPLLLRSRAFAAQDVRPEGENGSAESVSGKNASGKKKSKKKKNEAKERGGVGSVAVPVPEGTRGYEAVIPEGAAVPESAGGASYRSDNPASGTAVYTVRARLCLGEEATEVRAGVYCMGRELIESGILSGDEYIVCLESEPSGLYDFDRGILVAGRDYAEKLSKYNGNYMKSGEEWVRSCQTAIFDSEGELVFAQSAGISVSGGMSRRLDQKSFKLDAGLPYGEDGGRFSFDVFEDLGEGGYTHVGTFSHLRLRARSQVQRTFRETLVSRLAIESGYAAVSTPRPAVVFLNGSFYMLAEIEPTFSSSWIGRRFDLPDSKHIQKKKGKESSVLRKMEVADLFAADLTKKENRRALEAAVDMDNYLLYYALNVLDNNLDWPRNNVEAWRWTGDPDPDRPCTDGRLRFVLFDSDKAYNTDMSIADTFGTDTFVSMMENIKRGYESRFRDVMRSKTYRSRFITILCGLMNEAFETDHVVSLMKDECAAGHPECLAFFEGGFLDLIDEDQAAAPVEAAGYNDRIRRDLADYFGVGEQYRMEIEASGGVSVRWAGGTVFPGEEYGCDYYVGVPVALKASASPGWRFSHWEAEVGGKKVKSKKASITVDGSAAEGGKLRIRAVAKRQEGERVVIEEISASGGDDWIRLYNAGTEAANLGRYCLSDDPEDPQKYRLPEARLQPGDSILVSGSKRPGNDEDALCRCSFMLSWDEILSLTPDEGTGLSGDSLRVPRMSAGTTYGRKNGGSLFRWFDRRQ